MPEKLSFYDCIALEIAEYKQLTLSKSEKKELDLLNWWKSKSMHTALLIMACVAQSVLCIPASSSMSECNFSDAGNTITKKQNMLAPSQVDDLLISRSNYDLLKY